MPTQAEDGELISFCETHGYLITVTYPGSLTTFEIPSGKQVGAFQINTPYLDVLLQVHPMWLDQIGVAALFCDFPAADARESEGSFSLVTLKGQVISTGLKFNASSYPHYQGYSDSDSAAFMIDSNLLFVQYTKGTNKRTEIEYDAAYWPQVFAKGKFAVSSTPLTVWPLPHGHPLGGTFPRNFDFETPASGSYSHKFFYATTVYDSKLLTAYNHKLKKVWVLSVGEPYFMLSGPFGTHWDVSRDDKRQAISFDNGIRLYSLPGSAKFIPCASAGGQMDILFSQDGNYILAGPRSPDKGREFYPDFK